MQNGVRAPRQRVALRSKKKKKKKERSGNDAIPPQGNHPPVREKVTIDGLKRTEKEKG